MSGDPLACVLPRSRGPALVAVLGVLFLTFLDTTIVSVALADLEEDVSAGVIPLQWVVNAYALVFASLMLLGGGLADRFGRKRIMLGGVAVFAFGSVLCAVASGVALVITGRAVMGLGAAACEPGTLAVIRVLYPDPKQRARALGAWSAVSGLALALGPVVGGLLVEAGGWRWVFWFNLVVALVLLAVVARVVPESRDPQAGRLDLPGVVLAAAGVGCVIYAAISGEYRGFGTVWIVALFVLGGVCLIAFGPVEARRSAPLLDVRLIRRPIVASALFAAFTVYFGVFAIFFCTALYLDLGLGYSGAKLAGTFAPMAVAIVLGSAAAGWWVGRRGSRLPMVVGCALAAAGMLLARAPIADGAGLSAGVLSTALAVAGLGFGVTVVPLTSAVLLHLPERRAGMAASATNTARQLGAVVAVAALGAVLNAHLVDALREFGSFASAFVDVLETGGSGHFDATQIPDSFKVAFADGLRVSLLVAVALTLLAGIGAALVREPPVSDQDTSTGSTPAGSAPPSTASTGSP